MFYSGPQFAIRGNAYRFHDWAGPRGMGEEVMGSYGLPPAPVRAAAE
jgi:hypothetical protein